MVVEDLLVRGGIERRRENVAELGRGFPWYLIYEKNLLLISAMVQSRTTIIGKARTIRKLETETLMSHCQGCSEMQWWGSSSSMTEGESCESSVAVYPGLLRVPITSDGNDYIIYSNDIHKIPSLMLKTISVGAGLLTVLILSNLFVFIKTYVFIT